MTILRFPRHLLHRCVQPCEREGHCVYCDGVLALCVRCGGAESSLPTDCPGERMSDDTADEVSACNLDYRRRDGWVRRTLDKGWQIVT